MRVCFLTVQAATPFYFEIASRLERAGYEISWISPSARWSSWLRRKGVAPEALLDLTEFAEEWSDHGDLSSEDWERLEAFDAHAEHSVRDLILMDRLVSHKDETHALRYTSACIHHSRAFLTTRQIQIVFAESSYVFAFVVAQLCRQLGIPNYNIDTVRFPDGRFGFFEGMFQERLAGTQGVAQVDVDQAAAFHRRFLESHAKPAYFYGAQRAPRLRPVLAWKVLRNMRRVRQDPHDETEYPVARMVKDQLFKSWNHVSVRRGALLARPISDTQRPFVLYGLHKQPEIGIDVWASYLSNQAELIRCLSRSIPIGYDLYVKAHANDLGGRSRGFFKLIAELPRVRIVDPLIDSHELIMRAELVVSITGSMAFEAGLYGRRAVALSSMFFSPLLVASGIDPYSLNVADISDLLRRPHPADDPGACAPVEFLAWVHAHSFSGIFGDPLTDRRCMEPKNLDDLGNGFLQFLTMAR